MTSCFLAPFTLECLSSNESRFLNTECHQIRKLAQPIILARNSPTKILAKQTSPTTKTHFLFIDSFVRRNDISFEKILLFLKNMYSRQNTQCQSLTQK